MYVSLTPLPSPPHPDEFFFPVWNIVGNAVKFTSEGTVGVQLRMDEQSIVISVSDTGRGISEENLAMLFQPFTQVRDF